MANQQIKDLTAVTTIADLDVFAIDQASDSVTKKITKGSLITTLGVITSDQASAIVLNTDKITFDSTSSTKLGTIATNAEVNTIETLTAGEPTGSDVVLNVVSLSQSEYDAGTKVSTTFYLIV